MPIVIIGGLPCSGKTKLAERVQAQVQLPLLSKDVIKELLFDKLGAKDRQWSRQLSSVAYEILFRHANELARAGAACILEGNFREDQHRDRFVNLCRVGATFVQVYCHAEPSVLVQRFTERAKSGLRHAGHADVESIPEIELEMRTTVQRPLAIEGVVVDCDTTVDWSDAIDRAVDRVREQLTSTR